MAGRGSGTIRCMGVDNIKPVLSTGAVERLLHDGLPSAAGLQVIRLEPRSATIRLPVNPTMVRPGGTLSGPMMFAAADSAMYAVILGHLGPELLAVTTDTSIHFLRRPPLRDVEAEARILKLGRRLVICQVEIRTVDDAEPVAIATGTYSLPPRPGPA